MYCQNNEQTTKIIATQAAIISQTSSVVYYFGIDAAGPVDAGAGASAAGAAAGAVGAVGIAAAPVAGAGAGAVGSALSITPPLTLLPCCEEMYDSASVALK